MTKTAASSFPIFWKDTVFLVHKDHLNKYCKENVSLHFYATQTVWEYAINACSMSEYTSLGFTPAVTLITKVINNINIILFSFCKLAVYMSTTYQIFITVIFTL